MQCVEKVEVKESQDFPKFSQQKPCNKPGTLKNHLPLEQEPPLPKKKLISFGGVPTAKFPHGIHDDRFIKNSQVGFAKKGRDLMEFLGEALSRHICLKDADFLYMTLVYPPPRIPVTNEGLGWDSLLKME